KRDWSSDVCSSDLHHHVDDPRVEQVGGGDALGTRDLGGAVGLVVEDRAGALGWERGEPAVVGAEHAVGGQEGESSTAGALAEDHRDGRGGQGDEVGETARDLPGQSALL